MPRHLVFAALLAAFGAQAQTAAPTAGEIAFWETVRDSKNPAELQAYLQAFPDGMFAPIARARLAALQKPAAQPSAPAAAGVSTGLPQIGDTWTYRLTYPKRFGVPLPEPAVRTHVIKVENVSRSEIVDQLVTDGTPALSVRHTRGAYLLTQGVSIFSPYFVALGSGVQRYSPIGNTTIQEPSCRSTHACTASARVVGQETVTVPAGTFTTTKIVVDESWRPGPSANALGQFGMATANGGRTLTIWYAPEVKRAVKFASRHGVGDTPPIETHFDLELMSYQVK